MQTDKYTRWILAPLLVAAIPAWAANHIVIVGRNIDGAPAFVFTPSTLTIAVGDTVTFTNNSGGFHNVDTTGGPTTFKCSVNCTTNNTPNVGPWSDTVTFSTAGTVTYQCDTHFDLGMLGSITVQAPTPVKLQSFGVH